MNLESVREYCLSLPHTTEIIQWGNDLLFKIGGKMFAVVGLEPSHNVVMSFKATPEHFFELQEREGVIPAPYMARNQWLALQRFDAVRDDELRDLIAISYRLVFEKLPRRVQQSLASGEGSVAPKQSNPKKSAAKKPSAPAQRKKTKPSAKAKRKSPTTSRQNVKKRK
jgi:predicted DNA-binding protein (MmcQ/YjbR family)